MRISAIPVTMAGSRDSGSLPLMMTRSAGGSGRQPARSKPSAHASTTRPLHRGRSGARGRRTNDTRFIVAIMEIPIEKGQHGGFDPEQILPVAHPTCEMNVDNLTLTRPGIGPTPIRPGGAGLGGGIPSAKTLSPAYERPSGARPLMSVTTLV